MWTGILVTLVLSAGAFGLTEKDWKTAVIEYYANWTIAINIPQHDGFGDFYTQDVIHLENGMPAMNYHEYRQFLTNRGYYPYWLYVGFVELLYSNEEVALDRHIGVSRTDEGNQFYSKGLRLFKIVDGRVKEWVGIFNRD